MLDVPVDGLCIFKGEARNVWLWLGTSPFIWPLYVNSFWLPGGYMQGDCSPYVVAPPLIDRGTGVYHALSHVWILVVMYICIIWTRYTSLSQVVFSEMHIIQCALPNSNACVLPNTSSPRCIISYDQPQLRSSKIEIQDSRFKHCLFRRNTDIHIYITIMDTWQNMFLNGNVI